MSRCNGGVRVAPRRRVHSISTELVRKSREAALTAIQVFNNPLVQFKSETYIVLMVIAWTYLLHSYYRRKGIEYRYYRHVGKRRVFERTKNGEFKYWELERCLNDDHCPLDRDTINNLRFLIPLRHEIEHQMTMSLDNYLSGRYQACAINYSQYVKSLFGSQYGINHHLTYSIQFLELSREQVEGIQTADDVPERLKAFIAHFDQTLTEEEYQSPRFSYRLLFTRRLVNRPGQADRVIEFISPESELAENLEREYWVKKDVERPKFLPKQIVALMRLEGHSRFNMNHHTQLWKVLGAKTPGKGLGVQLANTWYWYEPWVEIVRRHCLDNEDLYR